MSMQTPMAKLQVYIEQIEKDNERLRRESDSRLKRRIIVLEKKLNQIATLSEINYAPFEADSISERDSDQPDSND